MAKVCAVFGGSRGIGKAVAELLAKKGCRLAIVARNLEVAQTTARNLGAGHLALSCDVSNEREVQNTFEEMQRNLGPINYLVNAAGINRDGLLLRTKTEDMIAQIHTNLLGTMLTCKAAVKTMIQHQGGAIVNVGSIVGLKGNSGQSVYSATKAGLVGFSRSLAKEVAKKQIRVNVVAPGFIRTEMTAHLEEDELKKAILLGRFGEPHEVAQAVVFLLETFTSQLQRSLHHDPDVDSAFEITFRPGTNRSTERGDLTVDTFESSKSEIFFICAAETSCLCARKHYMFKLLTGGIGQRIDEFFSEGTEGEEGQLVLPFVLVKE